MMKYILQKKEDKVYSYLLDEAGHAVEIHADSPADGPKLGDIYIGLVQNVARNINAAFVEILPGMNGYLPFDEIVEPIYTLKGPSREIQAGDQLVVQISRDAFGDKDVSLTTKIALRGRYAVLTHGGMGLGVSRKIPEEKRALLKDRVLSSEEFADIQKRIGPCGIVLRTNASAGLENESLANELSSLESQMLDLKLKAPYRSVHSNLLKTPPRWLDRVLHLQQDTVECVMTDDLSLYRQIAKALQEEDNGAENGKNSINTRIMRTYTRLKYAHRTYNSSDYRDFHDSPALSELDNQNPQTGACMLRFYNDQHVSMDKLFSLERELDRALSMRVNLKSGADLVIQSTEALHVIDVNSGRVKSGKKPKEEALLEVNLEAAREISRQIRLRNLSGIIIIDFINLKSAANSKRIMEELRIYTAKDPIRTQVVDMTKLGLVEMTRQKIELPLAEIVRISN